MKKKTYEQLVKERMQVKFPKNKMGGTFRKKPYNHIFQNREDNFIDGKFPTKKCLKGNLTNADIKYHYAEHLNSSQAMCIAYFKRFFESEKNECLLAKILMMMNIDVAGAEFTDAVFEYIPPTPKGIKKEGTNFDFYLKLSNGKQITWEIKFTESEFGRISPDKINTTKYKEKWEDIYTAMLFDCAYYSYPAVDCDDYRCLSTGELTNDCCVHDQCTIHEFYEHYQIRRNILYAKNKGDYVLFLTPRENDSLSEERAYIEYYADKWGTNCIRNIYWEDLLEKTLQVVSCDDDLLKYYKDFKVKYFE